MKKIVRNIVDRKVYFFVFVFCVGLLSGVSIVVCSGFFFKIEKATSALEYACNVPLDVEYFDKLADSIKKTRFRGDFKLALHLSDSFIEQYENEYKNRSLAWYKTEWARLLFLFLLRADIARELNNDQLYNKQIEYINRLSKKLSDCDDDSKCKRTFESSELSAFMDEVKQNESKNFSKEYATSEMFVTMIENK